MSSFFRVCLMSLFLLSLVGCATDGSFLNPFESSEPADSSPYYYSEFDDVPIPNDMSESQGRTYISFAPSGLKCGVQYFSGRVEIVSLMNTTRRSMAANGWTLRALLRSKESVLVFEKVDRTCVMYISDGLVYTGMTIFMSPRLEGDSTGVDISAYEHPQEAGTPSGGSTRLQQ